MGLLIDLFCNTQCYGVGLWLLNKNEKDDFTVGAILMFFCSLTLFLYGYYRRYHYSDTKFHRYAISWEIFVCVFVLPVFLVDDLILKSSQQEWFMPYVITDVVLKAMRTYFLLKHADTWIPIQRVDSWSQAVSNESFLDYFTMDAQYCPKVGAGYNRYGRAKSLNQAVSNESFLDCFKMDAQYAPKVGAGYSDCTSSSAPTDREEQICLINLS